MYGPGAPPLIQVAAPEPIRHSAMDPTIGQRDGSGTKYLAEVLRLIVVSLRIAPWGA